MANKFKWTEELVEDLLKCIGQYKTTMEFKGKDFNADKPRLYEEVRGLMVKINDSYTTFFGPVDLPNIQTDADEDDSLVDNCREVVIKTIICCCKHCSCLLYSSAILNFSRVENGLASS